MSECQTYELQEKFWNYGFFGDNCCHLGHNPEDLTYWEASEKYPAKKRRYGFFICDNCHNEFMPKARFQKLLISKVTGVHTLYPFEDLIKTNQDIVDYGAICLMQGIYMFGKSRAAELSSIMAEHKYNLKLTGKKTKQGLIYLQKLFDGKTVAHRKNGKYVMAKRRKSQVESAMKIASILDKVGNNA